MYKRKKRKPLNSQEIDSTQVSQEPTLVSVAEYRKLLQDTTSTDAQIMDRLKYLETLCRYVIKKELQGYAEKN